MPRGARNRIFRRPESPFWFAEWTDAEGIPHRQSTRCRDRRQAADWLAARTGERLRAEAGLPSATPRSLADIAGEYLAEHAPPVWSRGWWVTAEGMFRTQVVPHFGAERAVSSITESDAARFRTAQLGRTKRGGAVVSPSTVNRTLWMLSAFGKWCVKRGWHTSDPWDMERLPESDHPVPALEPAQTAQVLLALSARWRPIMEFALETGLRKSELSRLAWRDIDKRERIAWVVSSHQRGLTKGRRTRPALLSARAQEILDGLPRRRDGLVFGKVGDARRAFKRAAAAAGLERVWTHLFRHLGASRFSETGAGTADVQAFGGWTTTRMAERYVHTRRSHLLSLLDKTSPTPHPLDAPKEKGGSR